MSKQITIRDKVYLELSSLKQNGMSFSDVIQLLLDNIKNKEN